MAARAIDEAEAQRYAASLTRNDQVAKHELGYVVFAYKNELTGIIHLARTAQIGICGKQSGQRIRKDRGPSLRQQPPNEWTMLPDVAAHEAEDICTKCARFVFRAHQGSVGAR